MKAFFKVKNYNQWVEIEENQVTKFSCECPDFRFRHLKVDLEGPDAKVIVTGKCKHLKVISEMLDKQIVWPETSTKEAQWEQARTSES